MKRLGRNIGLTAIEDWVRPEQDSQPQKFLYSFEEGVILTRWISQDTLRHGVTPNGIADTKSHIKRVGIRLWAEYQNAERGDECRLR